MARTPLPDPISQLLNVALVPMAVGGVLADPTTSFTNLAVAEAGGLLANEGLNQQDTGVDLL